MIQELQETLVTLCFNHARCASTTRLSTRWAGRGNCQLTERTASEVLNARTLGFQTTHMWISTSQTTHFNQDDRGVLRPNNRIGHLSIMVYFYCVTVSARDIGKKIKISLLKKVVGFHPSRMLFHSGSSNPDPNLFCMKKLNRTVIQLSDIGFAVCKLMGYLLGTASKCNYHPSP